MIRSRPASRNTRIHALAVGLAVVGLVVRAMIPVGYMPGNLLAGEFMVLCPTGLPAQLFSAEHRHHGDMELMVDADRACPIGAALQYAALPTEPAHVAASAGNHAVPTQAPSLWRQHQSFSAFQARAPPAQTI